MKLEIADNEAVLRFQVKSYRETRGKVHIVFTNGLDLYMTREQFDAAIDWPTVRDMMKEVQS